MKHIRQIGGTKTVHGTSISREITKSVLTLLAVIALGAAVKSKKLALFEHLGHVKKLLYNSCREAVLQLRSLS